MFLVEFRFRHPMHHSLRRRHGGRLMRIAQAAPLYEAVPPRFYGGTERIVAHLTDALVELATR